MEDNFYRDDFEQMLRDTTEDFRMYPSRKVWHSIYNDLHPDRKWPSFAACLLLLTAILYVGVSNNNSISKKTPPLISAAFSAGPQNDKDVFSGVLPSPKNEIVTTANDQGDLVDNSLRIAAILTSPPAISRGVLSGNIVQANENDNNTKGGLSSPQDPEVVKAIFGENSNQEGPITLDKNTNIEPQAPESIPLASGNLNSTAEAGSDATESTSDLVSVKATNVHNNSVQQSVRSLSAGEKAWIEDFAFHNARNPARWKTNLSFQYYITPSIGYRHLSKNNDFEPANGALIRTSDNEEVTQRPAPNFEAGAVLILGVSKRLRIKSGLQFNFTNFNTYAHGLQHPTQTTVPMNDPRSGNLRHESYNTTFGNVLGSNLTKLNNQTLQLSLPLAVDVKIAGSDKIKWFMGAGVQPSYILSGNAYLISSDNKNFVQDDALLRKWNASANVETFVNIKTPSGVDINIGPQLRYQLLSSYTKRYSYTEKLYNVGIKIGVTKKL